MNNEGSQSRPRKVRRTWSRTSAASKRRRTQNKNTRARKSLAYAKEQEQEREPERGPECSTNVVADQYHVETTPSIERKHESEENLTYMREHEQAPEYPTVRVTSMTHDGKSSEEEHKSEKRSSTCEVEIGGKAAGAPIDIGAQGDYVYPPEFAERYSLEPKMKRKPSTICDIEWDKAREERPKSGLSGSPQLRETVVYVRGSKSGPSERPKLHEKVAYYNEREGPKDGFSGRAGPLREVALNGSAGLLREVVLNGNADELGAIPPQYRKYWKLF
ncbi:hypothetical protein B0T24DRAFT_700234 [Lasiosphaeria ovina]|uniref:Uncharacterized protein n=1 Tax=Lasiosphaeria ovina TaxID=92902 RepID=A0AAE0KHZ5_9PEZI|nr:hypothetical protein B0T24DRAFT_700234 [Lasiosphaeria ovina]